MVIVLAIVLSIIDGDTFKAQAKIWPDVTVETTVRMVGIDAPEMKSTCTSEASLALQARDKLAALLPPGTKVLLQGISPDKYGGRVDATVTGTKNQDIAAQMVASGLAHPYNGGKKIPWCP